MLPFSRPILIGAAVLGVGAATGARHRWRHAAGSSPPTPHASAPGRRGVGGGAAQLRLELVAQADGSVRRDCDQAALGSGKPQPAVVEPPAPPAEEPATAAPRRTKKGKPVMPSWDEVRLGVKGQR